MLAFVTTIVWAFFTLCFSEGKQDQQNTQRSRSRSRRRGQNRDETNNANHVTTVPHNSQSEFIKSILYNQVPLTAFLNRRFILASSTMLMGFILVTFVIPFFSLLSQRPGYQVSLQVTGALLIFFLATVMSVHVMKRIGTKTITWLAIALATVACVILSQAPKIDQD